MRRTGTLLLTALVLAGCADLPTRPEGGPLDAPPPLFSAGANYEITIHDIAPPGGGQYGTAFAVNDLGEVVLAADQWYLYHDGAWDPIPELNAARSPLPHQLSNAGLLVGQYEPYGYQSHAFTLDLRTGEFRDLGTLGLNAYARAVSENGIVVGYGASDYAHQHAWIWRDDPDVENDPIEILPALPGASRCQAYDVNDDELVVGLCITGWGRLTAVAWVDRQPVAMQGLGGYDDRALAVNASGWIAGTSEDNRNRKRVVLWTSPDAAPTSLSSYSINNVVAISDDGWITGYGQPFNYDIMSFLIIDGETHWLPTLYGHSTSVWDMSPSGIPVGRSWTPPYGSHPTMWTVQEAANRPPTIMPVQDRFTQESETVFINVEAWDPDGDALSLTASAPPFCGLADYGNGTGTMTCAPWYFDAGSYTITVTATEDTPDAFTASTSFTLNVSEAPPEVILTNLSFQVAAHVSDIGAGNVNALDSKLDVAGASLDRGNDDTAVNQLEAFINQVEALARSGRLSEADAAALIDTARAAIITIQGG